MSTVTLTYGLVSVDGHEYARDRGPYDDPIGRVRWRRRWVCSCGRTGDWKLRNDEQTYHDWAHHARQLKRVPGPLTPRRAHRPSPVRQISEPRASRTSVPTA